MGLCKKLGCAEQKVSYSQISSTSTTALIERLEVRRLLSGEADLSYCDNGFVVESLPGQVMDTALGADDKLLVLRWVFPGKASLLVRYNPDGSHDGSFGTNGIANLPAGIGARDVAIDGDGRIIALAPG